jgi:hypothetical protein
MRNGYSSQQQLHQPIAALTGSSGCDMSAWFARTIDMRMVPCRWLTVANMLPSLCDDGSREQQVIWKAGRHGG